MIGIDNRLCVVVVVLLWEDLCWMIEEFEFWVEMICDFVFLFLMCGLVDWVGDFDYVCMLSV